MKTQEIVNIGLNRIKTLAVTPGVESTPRLKAIFLAELAGLGYKLENPELYNDSLLKNFDATLKTLIAMKGGDVEYVPLFSGFPNNVPEIEEVFNIISSFLDLRGLTDECAHISELMSDSDKPISSVPQTTEAFEEGKADQASRKADKHSVLISLKLSQDIEGTVRTFLKNNLYAKSSIKESLKNDIEGLIKHFGLEFLEPGKVVFKEIKAYVMAYLWRKGDYDTIAKYVGTPTDILRMFASLTESDVSLAENIKFVKLSRPQRKAVLSFIENDGNLVENLNTYKGIWLALGRYIHPGEYKAKFPNAFRAFDTLRNDKVRTFNGSLEAAVKSKDMDTVLKLVKLRPGIFGRRLHELVDVFAEKTGVIKAFKEVADQIELKNLLVMEKYFATINDLNYRTVINKKGKVIVFPNNRKGKLSEARVGKIVDAIKTAIAVKCEAAPLEFEEGTKVWIDPDLRNYTVPLSLRKQSDGLMNISRGTRIKFDKSKTLRLFNYWKQSERSTDFDTSLIEFDKDMNYKGHVSYTNLSSDGIVHSGDLTSAPHGAVEFLDINMSALRKDIKYLGIQVYLYSGEAFNQVEKSYAGWMIRDKANKSRQSFDIKTVENKFNMVGQGRYAIPMIVDVEKSEIVFVDLYMNGTSSMNRVEGAVNDVSTTAREIVKMVDTKPNMLDLITYRMKSSGIEIVENKEDATATYGITDCDYSVDRVDEVLSELL